MARMIPWKTIAIIACIYHAYLLFYRSVENEETSYHLPTEGFINVLKSEDIENKKIVLAKSNNVTCLKSKEEYNKKYKQLNRNVPANLLRKKEEYFNDIGCITFPDVNHLEFSNIYWQTLNLNSSGVAYFFSAYYDNRDLVANRPVVRIISTIRNDDIPSVKYCQIWFPSKKKVTISNVSSAIHTDFWSYYLHVYILSCEIPAEYKDTVPAAVSVVEHECDLATNVLTVHYDLPETGEKEDFAICIKALFYPELDISFYLIQYVEMAKLLGIAKIYIYNYVMHPNMSAVLRYYENEDIVQVTPITIPGTRPNLPAVQYEFLKTQHSRERLYERAPHNDCFYMNMYKYKYIAFFDVDEIMIPMDGKSWKELINDVITNEKEKKGDKYKPPSAYLSISAYFLDALRVGWAQDIPQYMSMLQNVYRTEFQGTGGTKQLVDTELMLGITDGPRPNRCIGKCTAHVLNTSEAVRFHFRNKCKFGNCHGERDTSIWYYKKPMIANVDKVLKAISLL